MNVSPPARASALGKATLAVISLRLVLVPLFYVLNRVLLGARPDLRTMTTVFRAEGAVRLLATVLVALLFMIWVRSEIVALRNAGVLTKTTPLMAILGWFIPLANLVFPLLAVLEVFKYRAPRLTALPVVWWVAYCASMVTTNVALPFPIGMLVTLTAFGSWFAVVWSVVMMPTPAPAPYAYGYGAPPPVQPYYAPPPRG
jgi:Domain of unknown function (DUF4328)